MKYILFLSLVFLAACGQKSEIIPLFSSEPVLANNGNFTLKVTVPLSENTLSPYSEDPVESTLPVVGTIVEQFKLVFFNLGATLGFGKTQIQIQTPLPDINFKELDGVYIRDIFFVMDNRFCDEANPNDCETRKFYTKPDTGEKVSVMKKPSFEFLDKLMVNIETHNELVMIGSDIKTNVLDVKLEEFAQKFEGNLQTETSKNIGTYSRVKAEQEEYLKQMERMFYVETTNPVELRKYLLNKPEYAPYLTKIIKNSKMIIVEATSSSEQVIRLMKNDPEISQYDLGKIRTCEKYRCIKVELQEVNLAEIIKNKKQLDLNVYLDIFSVPRKVFWLKGFVDLEVKLKINI
ncbi:MAG: hypothetical protein JNM93_06575 [Bacteriovoracaceae bacterium]|nr:hypothetical protein [Bacteriovoracaceae bacterium]